MPAKEASNVYYILFSQTIKLVTRNSKATTYTMKGCDWSPNKDAQ